MEQVLDRASDFFFQSKWFEIFYHRPPVWQEKYEIHTENCFHQGTWCRVLPLPGASGEAHPACPCPAQGSGQSPVTVAQTNKTQCQLCKRLAGPFIPLSWSFLVWKRVSLWMWSLGGSSNHFPVYWAIFGMVTNKRQPGDPRASLLLTSVRRQSFAI